MQSLDLHRTYARPAAVQALPGTWPSCAQEPRDPGFATRTLGTGTSTGCATGLGGTAIHQDIGIIGRDRRDEDNQRGRAVACA